MKNNEHIYSNKMAAESVECVICLDEKSSIFCPYCPAHFCKNCLQESFNYVTTVDCPVCRKEYSFEFLQQFFSKKYLENMIRTKQEEHLFSIESSLLQTTLGNIVKDREKKEELKLLERQISELQVKKNELRKSLQRRNQEEEEKRSFVYPCPADGCRGFLSTRWKCGICSKIFCPECHEEKDEKEHECDPKLVENIKFAEKGTKRCPTCGVPIFKTEGCSQMFCVGCHTAFNWQTLRVIHEPIHNPHYFQWLKSLNGNVDRRIDDIPCGGLIDMYMIRSEQMIDIRAGVGYIQEYLHDHINEIEHNQDNENIRKKYLLNQIDLKEFKRRVYIATRRFSRMQRYYRILQTFTEVASGLIRDNVISNTEEKGVEELEQFRNIVNVDIKKLKDNKYATIRLINEHFSLEEDEKQLPLLSRERNQFNCMYPGCNGFYYLREGEKIRGLCFTHQNDVRSTNLIQGKTCTSSMKSGKRQGQICGRPSVNLEGTLCVIHLQNLKRMS